jgi:hypothetical protein
MNRRNMIIGGGAIAALAGLGVFGWRSSVGSSADYDRYAAALRAPLPDNPAPADLIRYATLAANGTTPSPGGSAPATASSRSCRIWRAPRRSSIRTTTTSSSA